MKDPAPQPPVPDATLVVADIGLFTRMSNDEVIADIHKTLFLGDTQPAPEISEALKTATRFTIERFPRLRITIRFLDATGKSVFTFHYTQVQPVT